MSESNHDHLYRILCELDTDLAKGRVIIRNRVGALLTTVDQVVHALLYDELEKETCEPTSDPSNIST